jgi:uncharacterized damage-inducible protein DinB
VRQLISAFEASGAALDEFVSSLASDPDVLHEPVDGGASWTGADVLAHLLEAELVYAVRIGQVLTLPEPVIQAYDQDAWVRRFAAVDGGGGIGIADWVALHRLLRQRLCALLTTLSPDEWVRGGRHEERGVETVSDIVGHLVEHDGEHLAQLRAAVAVA